MLHRSFELLLDAFFERDDEVGANETPAVEQKVEVLHRQPRRISVPIVHKDNNRSERVAHPDLYDDRGFRRLIAVRQVDIAKQLALGTQHRRLR